MRCKACWVKVVAAQMVLDAVTAYSGHNALLKVVHVMSVVGYTLRLLIPYIRTRGWQAMGFQIECFIDVRLPMQRACLCRQGFPWSSSAGF